MLSYKNHALGRLRNYISAVALIILGPGLLTWSWNKIAVDLLALPSSKYVHGIALLIGITIVTLIFRMVQSLFGKQNG